MSLRFRLIGLVCIALVASLVLGGLMAWVNASRSIRTEMHSALLVGRQTIENAIERLQNAPGPSRSLDDLVASFEGRSPGRRKTPVRRPARLVRPYHRGRACH